MRIPAVTVLLVLLHVACADAQPTGTLILTVQHDGSPVAGATITLDGVQHATDATGRVSIPVGPGDVVLTVTAAGLAPEALTLSVSPGQRREVTMALEPQEGIEEHVIVSATRTGTRLEDQPLRVEVIEAEEIEEKIMMTPGDIVMMLNEMGGMRVQATAPSLGAASVRIQGMRGRYTRVLADGLPLFGDVGSLGLLQIPPMDLARVEVIKGVASSLYGAGAMGGVVNLISRRPGSDEWVGDAVLNLSSRGATDVVSWMGGPVAGRWTATILAGVHAQAADDVDGDGWADLPAYARGVVRPRLFWEDATGRSVHFTGGLTIEDRSGGTVDAAVLPATGAPYGEALGTISIDAGGIAQTTVRSYVVTARGAFAQQHHDHTFGEMRERDRHDTAFGEIAVRGAASAHAWVAGAAMESEAYRPRDLPVFRYTYVIPGVFLQDDIRVAPWLSVSVSGRLDHHSQYGTFFSPRVAALVRRGAWTSRLSIGTGFFGPGVLTEETEAAGLSRLTVLEPLRAERGRALSLDLTRTMGPVSATVTLFASRVSSPLHVTRDDTFSLRSLDRPATNRGVELVAIARHESFSVTSTYAYVRSREQAAASSQDVPLTPRHASGVVAMWEREGEARVGFEWYYTGRQRLEDNPYRQQSEPYSVIGLLVERQFDRFRLFVNGENLTNVRQTQWNALVRPARAVDGRWATDAWAPLDGRTINGGVRIAF